jgi:hypothetical protein
MGILRAESIDGSVTGSNAQESAHVETETLACAAINNPNRDSAQAGNEHNAVCCPANFSLS